MSIPLRQYVELILRGEFARAGVEHPRNAIDDLETLAYLAHCHSARRTPFPDPRHLAVALGFRLLPRAPRGMCGEATAFGVIAFRADHDSRVQGLRVMHGLAHAILSEERSESCDSDAWILTGCLFVHRRAISSVAECPEESRTHAPPWLIAARLAQLSEIAVNSDVA